MSESRRRRRSPGLNAEINVTSLVDVAFTLLVIFIITAPIMQGGIEVDLPSAEAAPLTSAESIVVSLDREGHAFVGDVPVGTLDELRTVFPQVVQAKNAKGAALKADANVNWARVVEVLGALMSLDVVEVGLIVEPTTTRRR
jgi:biopolymer transport protein TolR